MEYTKELINIKAVISEFQTETQSNNVLDLCVWIENRISREHRDKEDRKKYMKE
jgi:hypothetical protein